VRNYYVSDAQRAYTYLVQGLVLLELMSTTELAELHGIFIKEAALEEENSVSVRILANLVRANMSEV
jgi:hypothetical protein